LQPLVGTTVADAAFWHTLGEAHLASGEAAQAEDAFRQAVALDPNSASANYSLGYLFQLHGKLPEAIQAYNRVLEADPYKAEALGNLAAAYSKMGEQDKAARALEEALKLEPGNLKWRSELDLQPRRAYKKTQTGRTP
jgi:protein O-GlcNAc transferase